MLAPQRGVDGSLHPVPVSDLDQEVLKELMANNSGLTLNDLKKRPECPSLTTTSVESYDDLDTPVVSPPFADADNHPIEIANGIPPVNPELLTLKHHAFASTTAYSRGGP